MHSFEVCTPHHFKFFVIVVFFLIHSFRLERHTLLGKSRRVYLSSVYQLHIIKYTKAAPYILNVSGRSRTYMQSQTASRFNLFLNKQTRVRVLRQKRQCIKTLKFFVFNNDHEIKRFIFYNRILLCLENGHKICQ